jgi:putative transposase
MSRALSPVYRQLSAPALQRRGPLGAMSDDALTTAIRGVLAASPFHGEGHRKIWARLRHAGTGTSLRRVLRLMRQHNLLAPTRVGSPRGPRNHDGTIIPDTLDMMWGTDLTTRIYRRRSGTFGPVLHRDPARPLPRAGWLQYRSPRRPDEPG